jgi:hypothetical protein
MNRLLKIAQALGFSITLLGTVTGAATILLHYLGSGPIRPVHRGVLLIAIFLIFIGLLLLAFCYAWRWERRATPTDATSAAIDAVPADDTDGTDDVILDSRAGAAGAVQGDSAGGDQPVPQGARRG